MEMATVDNEPITKQTKALRLIVVAAFDRDEMGELVPATEATQWPSDDRALRAAKALAEDHAGVVAWARSADPVLGEYGEPEVLAQYGDVPPME